jgi:putative endonuclease
MPAVENENHRPAPIARNWVCYLLRCADDTLYCGITNDLDKRLAAHNAGTAAKYTRVRLPVEVVHAEECADKSAALKREIAIKKMPRAAKLALVEAAVR